MVLLADILKDRAFPDSGNILYDLLSNAILKKEQVCIDMKGVVTLPTLFLNPSLGRIIENYGLDKLKECMIFRNITKGHAEKIIKYTEKFIPFSGQL